MPNCPNCKAPIGYYLFWAYNVLRPAHNKCPQCEKNFSYDSKAFGIHALAILLASSILLATPVGRLENVYFFTGIIISVLVGVNYLCWKFFVRLKEYEPPVVSSSDFTLLGILFVIILLAVAIFRFYSFFHG